MALSLTWSRLTTLSIQPNLLTASGLELETFFDSINEFEIYGKKIKYKTFSFQIRQ